jgi:hypothetical protein
VVVRAFLFVCFLALSSKDFHKYTHFEKILKE